MFQLCNVFNFGNDTRAAGPLFHISVCHLVVDPTQAKEQGKEDCNYKRAFLQSRSPCVLPSTVCEGTAKQAEASCMEGCLFPPYPTLLTHFLHTLIYQHIAVL